MCGPELSNSVGAIDSGFSPQGADGLKGGLCFEGSVD